MRKLLYILLLFGSIVQAQFSPITGVVANQSSETHIFPQDNAASITTEVNSVGSWYAKDGVRSEVTVNSSDYNDGSYSINIEAIGGDAVSSRAGYIQFDGVSGQDYRVTWDMKQASGTASLGRAFDWQNVDSSPNQAPTTSWASYSEDITASSTGVVTLKFFCSASSTSALDGDILLVDKVLIIEL